MSDDLSDDNSSTGPSKPRKRRGWEGEHLELERKDPTTDTASHHAAVDLEQFRNTQVGKGYQAKHVIRQRLAPNPIVSLKGMTQKNSADGKRANTNKRKALLEEPSKKTLLGTTRLHKYLQCEGLRKFRKELATIEYST